MQARGPLMIEHRLIERMISLIKDTLVQIKATRKVDPIFVYARHGRELMGCKSPVCESG